MLGGEGGFDYNDKGEIVNRDPKVIEELTKFAEAHWHWYNEILAYIKEIGAKLKGLYYKITGKDAKQQSESQELDEIYRRLVQLKGTVNIKKAAQNDVGQFMSDVYQQPTSAKITSDADIEAKNIISGKKAITSLIEQAKNNPNSEKLTIQNAMYRTDIGYIDFVWGKSGNGPKFKKGYGVSHIIAKRDFENGTGLQTVYKLVEVIAKSVDAVVQHNETNMGEDRIRLYYDNYTVVLSQKSGGNSWLLTGWENQKETVEFATREGDDSSSATAVMPTLTRHNGVNSTVSTTIIPNSDENVKQKQFDIIQATNPMWDDYHTGIRSVEDIRTWEEVLQLDDEREGQFVWGDFSREDAERALKENSITVYSSHPIENGTFVSTSYVQAQEYAGGASGGKVYSKTVALDEVAWINGDEGQYANVNDADTKSTPTQTGQAYVSTSRHTDLHEQYKSGKITLEQYQAEIKSRERAQAAEIRKLRQQKKNQQDAQQQLQERFKHEHGGWSETKALEVLRAILKEYPTKVAATKLVPAYFKLLTYIQNHPNATMDELEGKAIDLIANPILDSMKTLKNEEAQEMLADIKKMRFS